MTDAEPAEPEPIFSFPLPRGGAPDLEGAPAGAALPFGSAMTAEVAEAVETAGALSSIAVVPPAGAGVRDGDRDELIADVEHEQLVCSAVLHDPPLVLTLLGQPSLALRYDEFTDTRRRRFWQVVLDLTQQQVRPDFVTIRDRARALGVKYDSLTEDWLEQTRSYLKVKGLDSTANALLWARKVREASDWRALREVSKRIYALTVNRSDKPLHRARSEALDLVTRMRSVEDDLEQAYVPLGNEAEELAADAAQWFAGRTAKSLSTGYPSVDAMMGGGLQKARLIVFGGRPGTMKTAFAMNLAHAVGKEIRETGEQACVAIQSLEMQRRDLLLQMACRYAAIDSRLLTAGEYEKHPQRQLAETAFFRELDRVKELPIFVDQTDAVGSDQMFFRAALLNTLVPLKLLIIDYAELVGDEATEGEEQRVGKIFRRAKSLAKVLDIPVILLCQLNRGVEARDNKMPMLADIRYSGTGEAAADAVWFTYDPGNYKLQGQEISVDQRLFKTDNKHWYLIIAKWRYGQIGPVELFKDPQLTLIIDPKHEVMHLGKSRPAPLPAFPGPPVVPVPGAAPRPGGPALSIR